MIIDALVVEKRKTHPNLQQESRFYPLERLNDSNIAFRGWSNSVCADANPDDFGEPSYTAPDGCRAWITEKP
jgi:hypothetical protein